MNPKILVIDDDNALREMVGIVLSAAGFTPEYCPDGDQALEKFKQFEPDLVLLDVMLPGKDGIAVCREIRNIAGTPIIMLTAKTETTDVVLGLEAGADDYIVKPFEPSVLTARIKARLRPMTSLEEAVTIGPLTLDVVGHQVLKNGSQISLTPLEFNLLLTLAQKPKQVFTREMLLEKVWGYHYKAADNPKIVTTVRGIGYRAG